MKLIAAFFRLIRWPNLLFIALTQVLFYTCIILPSLAGIEQGGGTLTVPLFTLLLTASILIAAGGYIINDYFDINIDQVNKPGRMVVAKIINRRWAILLHLLFTVSGLAISLYVALRTNFIIGIANFVCALLLWFYSTTFKKKLLSGNIIISLLTAWTVMVLYFAANSNYFLSAQLPASMFAAMKRIFKFAVLYGGFAFIISLVREVVKDIEDIEGDARYQCKTMPIVWGIPASKVFVGVWLVVSIGALSIVQFYVVQLGWWPIAVYSVLMVILPLIFILKKFYEAHHTPQYHQLSHWVKLVMLTGILSMLFFKIYS